MKFTEAYFFEELVRFREVMGSRKYTLEQKETGFRAILYVFVNCPASERAQAAFQALFEEWSRRWAHAIFRDALAAGKGGG